MRRTGQRRRRTRYGLILALAAAALAGWAAPSGQSEGAEAPKTVIVELVNLRFEPAEIKVEPGTKVVFVNKDGFDHNVIHATPANLSKVKGSSTLFESPALKYNDRFEFTFVQEGTYPILCDVGGHYMAGMTAKVVVGKGGKVEDGFALGKKLWDEKKKK